MADSGRFPVLLLILVFLIPNAFAPSPAGISLTPLRIFLLIIAIPTLVAFTRRRSGQLYGFDWCYLGFVFWTCLAILVKEGSTGAQTAGQFALEFAVLYIFLQASITRTAQVESAFRFMFWSVAILGAVAGVESITHRFWMLDFAHKIMGLPELGPTSPEDRRLGLTRAQTVFTHSILYGIYCATLTSMIWFLTKKTALKLLKVSIISMSAFFSLSSAAVLVLMVQFILISAERATRKIKRRILVACISIAIIVISLSLFTGRGVTGTVILLSLNEESAYFRKLIWQFGKDDALRNPIFGIVPETWTRPEWMPPSMDNFWLFQALEGGLPSVLLLGAALWLIARHLFRLSPKALPEILVRMRTGWGFLMLSLILCGMTVHFFDKAQPYFAMMIGFGAALVRIFMDWEESGNSKRDGRDGRVDRPPGYPRQVRRSWL